MAAFDTTRPATVSPAAGFFSAMTHMVDAVSTWNDMRVTRKVLSQLSARELEDIGLTYGDIETIVRRRQS